MQGCNRWVQYQRSTVDVLYIPEQGKACFRGLQTCGSVWVCPVCAAKVSERRRVELGRAISSWRERGGTVVLITYTIRHKRSDNLKTSVDGLLKAREYMRSGRRNAEFKERFGFVGSVRALEVTHGANGWHPHVHELLFIAGDADLAELQEWTRQRWGEVLQLAGMREVNEHGVQVQSTYGDVAEYVAKFGRERSGDWGPEHELTKQVVKRGRSGSRTPVDFLADYIGLALSDPEGSKRAASLFRQYAAVFMGRRQLVWSKGLRQLLLPDEEEKTDEELAEETEGSYSVLLAAITVDDWRVILGQDCRGEVLEVASTGNVELLWDFLRSLGCQGPFMTVAALSAHSGPKKPPLEAVA